MSSAEAKPEVNFTVRDLELFALCVQCLKGGEFAVDYQKLAELGGYKNSNSSKAAFHGLKKKLDKVGSGTATANGPSLSASGADEAAATPASGKKRKTPAKSEGEDANGDEETPAKKKGRKPRATPKAKTVAAGPDADEDDAEPAAVKSEEPEEPTPAKKGRKPAAKNKEAAPSTPAAAEDTKDESDAKEESAEAEAGAEEAAEGQKTADVKEETEEA